MRRRAVWGERRGGLPTALSARVLSPAGQGCSPEREAGAPKGRRCLRGQGQPTTALPAGPLASTSRIGGRKRLGSAPALTFCAPDPGALRMGLSADGKSLKQVEFTRSFSPDLTAEFPDFLSSSKPSGCLCPRLWAGGVFPGTAGESARRPSRPTRVCVDKGQARPGFLHFAARQQLIGETWRQMLPGAPCDTALCHSGRSLQLASRALSFLTLTRQGLPRAVWPSSRRPTGGQ